MFLLQQPIDVWTILFEVFIFVIQTLFVFLFTIVYSAMIATAYAENQQPKVALNQRSAIEGLTSTKTAVTNNATGRDTSDDHKDRKGIVSRLGVERARDGIADRTKVTCSDQKGSTAAIDGMLTDGAKDTSTASASKATRKVVSITDSLSEDEVKEMRTAVHNEIKELKASIKTRRQQIRLSLKKLGEPEWSSRYAKSSQYMEESTPIPFDDVTDEELAQQAQALLKEEGELLKQQKEILEREKKIVDAESARLSAKKKVKELVRNSLREELISEKSQIFKDEVHVLKSEIKMIQECIMKDLADATNKSAHEIAQLSSTTPSSGAKNVIETGAPKDIFDIILEKEMQRLEKEAGDIWDDLDRKLKDSMEDINKNFKFKKAWATEGQKAKGITLKIRHCCTQKRAELNTWVNQSFVECGVCTKKLPKTLVGCHLKYCSECSCHVCFMCNCDSFHLSSQEEFFKASEETKTAKILSKKSKKKRKKARQRANAKQKQVCADSIKNVADSAIASLTKKRKKQRRTACSTLDSQIEGPLATCNEDRDENYEVSREGTSEIARLEAEDGCIVDFVDYLRDNRSILDLADLMDTLERDGVNLDKGHEGIGDFHDQKRQDLLGELKKLARDES